MGSCHLFWWVRSFSRRHYRFRKSKVYTDPTKLRKNIFKNPKIKVQLAISCFGVKPLIWYKGTMKQSTYLAILNYYWIKVYPNRGGCFPVQTIFLLFCLWIIMLQYTRGKNKYLVVSSRWAIWRVSFSYTWREAKRIWYDIPTKFIEKLYQSLPKKVGELQKNGGGIVNK